jgi:hypothetical protein
MTRDTSYVRDASTLFAVIVVLLAARLLQPTATERDLTRPAPSADALNGAPIAAFRR